MQIHSIQGLNNEHCWKAEQILVTEYKNEIVYRSSYLSNRWLEPNVYKLFFFKKNKDTFANKFGLSFHQKWKPLTI